MNPSKRPAEEAPEGSETKKPRKIPEVPDDYQCPLLHDIMRDPVVLNTSVGRSYERTALEDHLKTRPKQDPLTRQVHESHLTWVPNRNLKNQIEAWLRASVIDVTNQLVTAEDSETRIKAVRALNAFVDDDNGDNKVAAMEAGAIPALVAMLEVPEAVADVAFCLSKLARNEGAATAISGAIPSLVALATSGTDEAKENAAGAIQSIAHHTNNKMAIADAGGIPPLVALLTSRSDQAQENAALALYDLSTDSPCSTTITVAIPALVALLTTSGTDMAKAHAAGT